MRQRETEHERGRGREGDTESEAGSRLWAISPEPDAGLELADREIVTWAEVGRLTDWATQAPLNKLVFNVYLFRKRESAIREGLRERERENLKQALCSVGAWGCGIVTLGSRPGLKSRVGHSTDWATQTPWKTCYFLLPLFFPIENILYLFMYLFF